MKKTLRLAPLAALFLAVAVCAAAPQGAGSAALQRFTVLRGAHVLGPSVEMTGAEANCTVSGTGENAGVRCRPIGVTQKNAYTYNVTLIAQPDGTAYVIACRIGLVSNTWCKGLAEGRVLRGTLKAGRLVVPAGDKTRQYLVLATAQIGPLDADAAAAAVPAAAAAPRAAAPQQAAAPTAPAPAPVAAVAATPPAAASAATAPASTPAPVAPPAPAPAVAAADPAALPADCASPGSACVTFVSDPSGADIYVDDKFVGNTPSVLPLAAGTHEIRMALEPAAGAPARTWTRTFEASAGSRVTLRAPLQAPGN